MKTLNVSISPPHISINPSLSLSLSLYLSLTSSSRRIRSALVLDNLFELRQLLHANHHAVGTIVRLADESGELRVDKLRYYNRFSHTQRNNNTHVRAGYLSCAIDEATCFNVRVAMHCNRRTTIAPLKLDTRNRGHGCVHLH